MKYLTVLKKFKKCKYCKQKFFCYKKGGMFCSRSCWISWKNIHIKINRKPFTNAHKKGIGKGNKKAWARRRKNGTASQSIESNIKRSKTLTGRVSPNKNRVWSEQYKRKQRVTAIKRRKEYGIAFPTIGHNEVKFLDEQEKIDNCKIIRQYEVAGYIADGYCSKTNTIYEVYEKYHEKTEDYDKKRQREIQKELKCKFIIIWDKLW